MRSRCFEWQGCADGGGYGVISIKGRVWRVHRLAFIAHHGFAPQVVMHTCDNPPCFNLRHLRAGTHRSNADDMVRKGRQAQGERHWKAKATLDQVLEMRRRYAAGESIGTIAASYGFGRTMVHLICVGVTWATT